MSSNKIKMPSAQTLVSAAASVAASAMLFRSFVPHELRGYIFSKLTTFLGSFSFEFTLVIEEYDGLNQNQLFKAANIYLGSIISPNTQRLRASLLPKDNNISVSMEKNQEIIDTFDGVVFKWKMITQKTQSSYITDPDDPYTPVIKDKHRYLELRFHKKHKETALNNYLPHLLSKSNAVKEETKTLKLFTLTYDGMRGGTGRKPWQSVRLDHPATFETLAMDCEMKRMIMADLERFVRRKEFYRRVGKAWKRGYLLYGPPGTGKSSLIAAMANYLNFDIYDLELTDLRNNSGLRRLLISTGNRSILVVEDIDCSIDLQDRIRVARPQNPHHPDQGNEVTLSGLLNFTDGLWSSCGDERVIVFTTNHKGRLDPALLRPGRMDLHIHMSYCTPCGFKLLASNYLGIAQHPLFSEVEQLIQVTKVTPAEVGEQLMKDEEPEIAIRGLIVFLGEKKESDKFSESQIGTPEVLTPCEGRQCKKSKGN